MKCPCEDCLTLAICKNANMDLHGLANKCSYMMEYLGITSISKSSYSKNVFMIFFNIKPFIYKCRINKIKQFIPHTHTLNL